MLIVFNMLNLKLFDIFLFLIWNTLFIIKNSKFLLIGIKYLSLITSRKHLAVETESYSIKN